MQHAIKHQAFSKGGGGVMEASGISCIRNCTHCTPPPAKLKLRNMGICLPLPMFDVPALHAGTIKKKPHSYNTQLFQYLLRLG